MAKDRIEIEVLAKGVKGAQKDIEKLKKEIGKTGQQTESTGDNMIGKFAAIAAGAFAAFQTIKKAMNLANEFALFEQGVKAMETQFGVSSKKILKSLGEVSKGTISNADLISSANRAMALNVTQDVDQMAQLLEVARVRGQAMGVDTTQAFNDIVTGIGRASPLILDNLGIITKGWADEARAAGKAFDAQFILNKVLADGAKILERTGDVAVTNAEKFQQIEASFKNAKLAIGQQLLPEILKVTDAIADLGGSKGMEIVIRSTRTLIALARFLALQFTLLGRGMVASITPFINLIKNVVERWDELKTAGKDTFTVLKGILGDTVTDTQESLKNQFDAGKKEITDFKDSVLNIFSEIDTAFAESNRKRLALTTERTQAEIEAEKAAAMKKAKIISIFTDTLATESVKAGEINKKALKKTMIATINAIANELKAFATAALAKAIILLSPGGVARAIAGLAAVSTVQALATKSLGGFRQGTRFSPSGPAVVGEAGPEIVNFPQGTSVTPTNEINTENNDNRNITINVSSPNAIEFVNELQSTYGISIFEGG